MPTSNPRVNVVLEKPLFVSLRKWAKREGVSLSTKIRDLVREAIVEYEDSILVRIAEERSQTFERERALSHDQVWK